MTKRRKFTILLVLLLIAVLTSCIKANAEEPDVRFEILLPVDVQIECQQSAEEFNISPTLLMSLVYQESRGMLPNATQITNPYWFRHGIEAVGAEDVKKNRDENIKVCAWYLRQWLEEYDDVYLVLEMWNEGQETALATHNPDKPSRYAREIEERAEYWEPIFYMMQKWNRNPNYAEEQLKRKEKENGSK